MSIPTLSAKDAKQKIARGEAILVDVREPAEHGRESIPGAVNVPLSGISADAIRASNRSNAPAIIYHCQSGQRTASNAERLRNCAPGDSYCLEKGLGGWKAAGFETSIDRSKPIELQRQVQIAAGSLVLLGFVLAYLISPLFLAIPAFVGGGLVFAGVTGWCGMAHFLAVMPWNKAGA